MLTGELAAEARRSRGDLARIRSRPPSGLEIRDRTLAQHVVPQGRNRDVRDWRRAWLQRAGPSCVAPARTLIRIPCLFLGVSDVKHADDVPHTCQIRRRAPGTSGQFRRPESEGPGRRRPRSRACGARPSERRVSRRNRGNDRRLRALRAGVSRNRSRTQTCQPPWHR
jgi:hypothetical protein